MTNSPRTPASDDAPVVLLFWIPLGAGGRVVAFSGRVYEAISAWHLHRPRARLFHAALLVHVDGEVYAIEMGPAWGNPPGDRGVTVTGPVGLSALGRSVLFRYEVRAWRGGVIPDIAYAVGGPGAVSQDRNKALEVLDLVARVPSFTWGRDAVGAGEMWNSNSLIAWLLARSGHDMTRIAPPSSGRAPGWSAGLLLAGYGTDVTSTPGTKSGHGRGSRSAEPHPTEPETVR